MALLAFLPFVMRFWGKQNAPRSALMLPHADAVFSETKTRSQRRTPWLWWLVWLLLVAAVMRPQWVGEPITPPRSGRDLMLAVDVSGSMAARDMIIGNRSVERLTAVKAVVGDFLTRREGDRAGLILFGDQAYLVTPLTFDLESLRYQLETSSVGVAGRSTAMGDAMGLAIKRMLASEAKQRVLILLTDGVSTSGQISPEQALALAKEANVKIYTIGIGGDGSSRGLFGWGFQPSDDMDTAMLTKIAEQTGGTFYRANNTAELANIYADLERLEALENDSAPIVPRRDVFYWPLGAAMLLMLLWLGTQWLVRRKEATHD